MSETLFGFARIVPKREHFDDARNAILEIVEPTLQEPGCVQFIVLADEPAGNIFLFEEWTNDDALGSHHDQPYTRSVMDHYAEWLAEPLRFETMLRIR